MIRTKNWFMGLGLLAAMAFAGVAFAATPKNMEHGGMQGNAQNGTQHSGMQGSAPKGMDHGGMQGNAPKGMQHGGMQGSGKGAPMAHNGTMNMPMMQGMMGNMMDDMKAGKMMPCMMKGCMMQTAMNDSMRQNKTFSDKAFLSAMIPHHEAAVEMAKAVLKDGKDPQVKQWAEGVIAAQNAEITQMQAWLKALGGNDDQAASMMQDSMHSMMTTPMYPDADKNFVAMMIGHHASAVEISVAAVLASQDEKVVTLANSIAQAQLNEIIAYRAWLKAKGE
ncbi:DUF305 domain-containing protein [Desulfovibrio cuneatus]|uniref:DUF305 domain-containing protein n=1 Tax=Desulfovibrio cuneatus TaxID=159728 RepID=UPI00068772C6|nr:DUF305 domain-containing protein [Desulfovibrio cuneatus]